MFYSFFLSLWGLFQVYQLQLISPSPSSSTVISKPLRTILSILTTISTTVTLILEFFSKPLKTVPSISTTIGITIKYQSLAQFSVDHLSYPVLYHFCFLHSLIVYLTILSHNSYSCFSSNFCFSVFLFVFILILLLLVTSISLFFFSFYCILQVSVLIHLCKF